MKMNTDRRGRAPLNVRRSDVSSLAATLFFDALDRPDLSRAAFREDWREVVTVEAPKPVDFACHSEFRDAYWAAESWSKFPAEAGFNRETEAYKAFIEGEDRCRESNGRLTDYFSRPRPQMFRTWMAKARKNAHWLLSGITPGEIMQRAGWGPGATYELSRSTASHQHKWVLASHITSGCIPWLAGYWRFNALGVMKCDIQNANRVTTVPKNSKTDRVIAIEPAWNSFFQVGLGRSIRKRLQSRVGLLTDDAQERNSALAREGSLNGTYATIDLKGASDSLSLALVELLCPPDLWKIICTLRSPQGEILGQVVDYEKVSSMGCGFTFELETALFVALALAVSDRALVFGDDIIVPTEFADNVIDLLREAGFEVNLKKTFTAGPFRESCGGHYFKGHDVTPPYFRRPLSSLPNIIGAGNRLTHRCDRGWWRDGQFGELHWFLSTKVPKFLWGPPGQGDSVLVMPFDAVHPKTDRRLQCFTGRCLLGKRRLKLAPPEGALLASLHGDTRVELFPTREDYYAVGKWFSPRWSEIGPWL